MINYLNSDNELCDLVDSPEYRRILFFYSTLISGT
jgi:hypothetical protein